MRNPISMQAVCSQLADLGVDLAKMRGLEFFAREGDWLTAVFAPLLASIEAWEIDPRFEPGLRRNLPFATIRIGDSFHMAREARHQRAFDFVSIDNPQGTFGPEARYCEHFEALELVPDLLDAGGVVVFNVNWAPYDYSRWPEWRERRNQFYGLADCSSLQPHFVYSFYEEFFRNRRLQTVASFSVPRDRPIISHMAYVLERSEPAQARPVRG